MSMKFFKLDAFTYFWLALILVAIIYGCYCVYKAKSDGKLIENRRRIEQIPSMVSTLGVLGTFIGITKGLVDFNTFDLTASIPLLLNGLKTAFYTSLAGMIGSLFLSHYVSSTFDKKDEGLSDINIAAGEIVQAVKAMSNANRETLKELKEQAVKQANDQAAFYIMAGKALENIQDASATASTNSNSLVLQVQSQTSAVADLKTDLQNINVSLGQLDNNTSKQIQTIEDSNQLISSILTKQIESTNDLGELVELTSGISNVDEEISDEVKKFGEKLHGEVLEIEDKMADTNNLLTAKFDEFTELLKKSNTEALVEVMKKVTEEFQKSMNELINKLIQENFEQLNTSVERLNQWQQENKEMIASLTSQYKEMANNFENTSSTLSQVEGDTKALVSDGGKLQDLINTLRKVMIDDENFIKITSNLTEATDLTKNSMVEFENSTRSLNEWVRKQRNFVDGVSLLINKLEELNKIRDYNEEFWRETKSKLEEGVSFISQGSRSLNQQLTQLDAKFYARLSATLAELDTCIQAMIKDRR